MANIKISQLPVGTTPLNGGEIVPIVQNGQTVKVTASDIGATATPGYTAEDIANKTQDVALDGTSTVKYPSAKAVKEYADSLVVGLLDDRGSYVPSVTSPGPYPSTGGSGAGGAIEKGDIWFISANGYIGTTAVTAGMSIRALSNAPGQTSTNWDLIDYSLGYTPENINNKITTAAEMTTYANSTVKYPAVKAVKDYIDARPSTLQGILDNDHNLANGLNFQGTDAGDATAPSATDINAFGTNAAAGNMESNINAFGSNAGYNNQNQNLNALGNSAGYNNAGDEVNALGNLAGANNQGNHLNALGYSAGSANTGQNVTVIGNGAGVGNTGNNVVAIGSGAGAANTRNNVVLFGSGASASANNQLVHRNPTMGYQGTIDYNNLTDNHTVNFPNADGTPVMRVNGVAADAAGDVTISTAAANLQAVTDAGNTTTNSITVNSLSLPNQYQPGNQYYGVSVENNQFKVIKPNGSSLFASGPGYAFFSGSAPSEYSMVQFASGNRTYNMPTVDGRLALSVNGQTADSAGNITLSLPNTGWQLSGNAGTTPGTNFIGTTDNKDVVFKANNNEFFRLRASAGDIYSNNSINSYNSTYNQVQVAHPSGLGFAKIAQDGVSRGYVSVGKDSSAYSNIRPNNLTDARNHQLPDANGTFVLSVNGVTPSNAGDVTLAAPYKTCVLNIGYNGSTYSIENTYQDTIGVTLTSVSTTRFTLNSAGNFTLGKVVAMPLIITNQAQRIGTIDWTFAPSINDITIRMTDPVSGSLSAPAFSKGSGQQWILEVRVYP